MGASHSKMAVWAAQDGRESDLVHHLNNAEDIQAALYMRTGPKDNTLLHLAASGGHTQCVRVLYDAGSNVTLNVQNKDGHTPLHLAASRHFGTVQLLLQLGANPNITTKFGAIPLHLAASTGNSPMVEELVNGGSPINAVESWGQTPLAIAASMAHIDCMKCLMRLGADLELRDYQHCYTALHVACTRKDMESVLVLLDGECDVHAVEKKGQSAVGVALTNRFYRVIPLLLEYGARPNEADRKQMSSALQKYIELETSTPLSLQRLCRVALRQSLGPSGLECLSGRGLQEQQVEFVESILDLCEGAEIKAKALESSL